MEPDEKPLDLLDVGAARVGLSRNATPAVKRFVVFDSESSLLAQAIAADSPPPPSPHKPADSPKLLDRLRRAIRVRHYSIRTEGVYVDWARRFILLHGKRHPASMG